MSRKITGIVSEIPRVFKDREDRLDYVKKLDPNIYWPIRENPIYYINKNGKIYNTKTQRLVESYLRGRDRKELVVNLNHPTKPGNMQRAVARLIFNTFLPIEGESPTEGIVTYKDNNPENCTFDNCRRNYTIHQWAYGDNRYLRQLADYPDYIISIEGKVYGIVNWKEMSVNSSSNGYLRVGLRNADGKDEKPNIHRLLALAFIPLPPGKSPSNLEVNHKNGKITDNRIDLDDLYGIGTNLEWVSPSENQKHTSITGLREGHRKTIVTNIKTGEKQYFNTITEAANSINTDVRSVTLKLNMLDPVDGTFLVDTKEIIPSRKTSNTQIKLINVKFGISRIYNSTAEFTEVFKCTYREIDSVIKNNTLYRNKYRIERRYSRDETERINDFIKYSELAKAQLLPKDFNRWDLSDKLGTTIAHIAAEYYIFSKDFPYWKDKNHEGNTVAHIAARYGTLPEGFDQWNIMDIHGWTVAHIAVKYKHLPKDFTQWNLTGRKGISIKQYFRNLNDRDISI